MEVRDGYMSHSLDQNEHFQADDAIFDVRFEVGPLGMTLRRNEHGIVTVYHVNSDSQAEKQGVRVHDFLWKMGALEVGHEKVTEEEWSNLCKMIRATRPLEAVFHRHADNTEVCLRQPFVSDKLCTPQLNSRHFTSLLPSFPFTD
jgi:hypothetical protein